MAARRISKEELHELADAFSAARVWRQSKPGIYTANANNWAFVVDCTVEANYNAVATNTIRNVEVKLSRQVTEVWCEAIRRRAN